MRTNKDPRHIARILACMDLYNFFYPDAKSIYDLTTLEIGQFSTKLRDYLFDGVKTKYLEIDNIINTHSSPVKTTDLDLLLLQILRIAVYEAFVTDNTPPKVAIDEAIELTRDFGNEFGVKKISGILGRIFEKTIKKEEDKSESV